MRVVLAGFGPFPGASVNPTALLVKALVRRRRPALAPLERTAHVFATTYAAVDRDLPKLLAAQPDIVLIFGLAARRREICVETRARNARSVIFPDASGQRAESAVIERGGPPALVGRAPFAKLLGALRASGLEARLSRDAGRYLCNYAYWQALQQAGRDRPLIQFIHVPAVRLMPRRRRGSGQRRLNRPSPAFARLVTAAEMLLVALAAASLR